MTRSISFPLALLLTGCAQLGLACTEMGCIGSLGIHLSRALADDAVVQVDLDGELRDCLVNPEGGQPATGCLVTEGDEGPEISVQMGGVVYDEVEVRISEGGADPVSYTVAPLWGEPWYPNGKACDGEDGGCVSGEADLVLD